MKLDCIVQTLCDSGIEFIIIGGWSAILHGSVHVTNDLDVFFRQSPENTRRLAVALTPFHPRLRDVDSKLPFVWDETTLRNGTMFTLITDLGFLDLLAEVEGLGSFDEVKESTVVVDAFGREVRTLDLPTLIKAKRAAGREKDLRIIPELEGLLEAGDA